MLDDILDPMQSVLDLPMRANDRSDLFSTVWRATADVIMRRCLGIAQAPVQARSLSLDSNDLAQADPLSIEGFRCAGTGSIPDRDGAMFLATMTALSLL